MSIYVMSSDKLQECTPSRRLSTMQASRGATNDVSSGMKCIEMNYVLFCLLYITNAETQGYAL